MIEKPITTTEARQIMVEGITKAHAFINIGRRVEKGSPLHKEMCQAALEALSWANDENIIDAIYDAIYDDTNEPID